jgi:hypothetical protein
MPKQSTDSSAHVMRLVYSVRNAKGHHLSPAGRRIFIGVTDE